MSARWNTNRHRRKRRRATEPRRRRMIPFMAIGILCIILMAFGIVILFEQQEERQALKQREGELHEAMASMEAESRRLEELESRVGSSDYVKQVAREELGMGYPDEVRFEEEP